MITAKSMALLVGKCFLSNGDTCEIYKNNGEELLLYCNNKYIQANSFSDVLLRISELGYTVNHYTYDPNGLFVSTVY